MILALALASGLLVAVAVSRLGAPGDFGVAGDAVVGVIGAFLGAFVFHLIGLDELGFIGKAVGTLAGALAGVFGLRLLKRKYGL